jgi:hypothetical protein
MPAAIRPTNIIVRIVMSPSVFAVFDHPFVRSQSALPQVRVFADVVLPRTVFFKRYSSANAIMHIMFACNLAFSTSQALIWRSFIYCSFIYCSFIDPLIQPIWHVNTRSAHWFHHLVAEMQGVTDSANGFIVAFYCRSGQTPISR